MRNVYRFIGFILLSAIITACGSSPPDLPTDFSWCYQYDFTSAENYNEVILEGSRSGSGLQSSNGILSAYIDHGAIVSPIQIRALVNIQIPDSDSRQLSANLNIFGVTESINYSAPASGNQIIVDSPDGGETFSNRAAVSFATASDTTASITVLEIYGNGASPFVDDNCDDSTDPPATDTVTNTPTVTFTPSITPTPSDTPETTPTTAPYDWCIKGTDLWVLGKGGDPNWGTSDGNGGFVSGFLSNGHRLDIRLSGSFELRRLRVNYFLNTGFSSSGDYYFAAKDDLAEWTAVPSAANRLWGGAIIATSDIIGWIDSGLISENVTSFLRLYHTIANGNATPPNGEILDIEVYGSGINPFGRNDCDTIPTAIPTLTPSPSPTLPITSTPFNFVWCYQWDFTVSDGGWNLADTLQLQGNQTRGVYSPGIGWVANNGAVAIEIQIPQPITQRVIDFAQAVGSTNIRLYPILDPFSDDTQPIASGYDTINYDGVETTSSIWVSNTIGGTITGVRLAGEGINNPFGANNCDVDLPSDNGYLSTPYQTPTGVLLPTYQPTNTPNPIPTPEATATPDPSGGSNGFSSTGTCNAYTGGDSPSGLFDVVMEWFFAGLVNFYNCVLMPPVNFIAGAIADVVAGISSLFDFFTGLFYTAIQSLVNGINLLVDFALNFVANFADIMLGLVANLANLIASLAINITNFIRWIFTQLIPYVLGWLRNLWAILQFMAFNLVANTAFFLIDLYINLQRIIGIVQNWAVGVIVQIASAYVYVNILWGYLANTSPEPIPGLPDCDLAPLEHNLCAVWYVLDNTFFAGTVGSFIIPALNVYFGIMITLFFLETIIERVQKLWEVFRRQ